MQQLLVIRHVRIFDGIRLIPQNTVIVENGLITSLGEDILPPQGDKIAEHLVRHFHWTLTDI